VVAALAQYRNCYILAHDAEGLLVVDQHVAHERLLYENLSRLADSGPLPRQVLLFPATIEVGPAAVELVQESSDALARTGFGIEPFGDAAVIVREVPAVLGREAAPETVVQILEGIRVGDEPGADTLFHRLLATVACHAAVRKGMPLSLDKMDYILQGLASCAAPSHCPHGRVISLRVDLSALDRGFGRTS
jgi:DNA mismatch repair protein MutL